MMKQTECWNIGILGRESKKKNLNHLYFIRLSILPPFHHSILPFFQFCSIPVYNWSR